MKFTLSNNFSQNLYTLIRRCGYVPIHDRKTGKDSFSKKLSNAHYPRFHLYITQNQKTVVFDLHLDQNRNRYQGQTAHNADYDSQEVKNELYSIYNTVIKYKTDTPKPSAEQTPSVLEIRQKKPASKKGWLSRLLGKN